MKAVYKDEEWRPVLDGWVPQEKHPWNCDLIQVKKDGRFGPITTKWDDWAGNSYFNMTGVMWRPYVRAELPLPPMEQPVSSQ